MTKKALNELKIAALDEIQRMVANKEYDDDAVQIATDAFLRLIRKVEGESE